MACNRDIFTFFYFTLRNFVIFRVIFTINVIVTLSTKLWRHIGELRYSIIILTLDLDGDVWSASRSGRFIPVVRPVVLHAVPFIRKSLRLENTQGSLQSGMPGSNSETRRFGQQYRGTVFCWSHYYLSWPNYCKGLHGQGGWSRASHDPDVNSEQRCSFPSWQCPNSHSWNSSAIVWRAWKGTSTSSLATTMTTFEHHWTTVVTFGD
jgi:hypothetical protein